LTDIKNLPLPRPGEFNSPRKTALARSFGPAVRGGAGVAESISRRSETPGCPIVHIFIYFALK
jgi:hypothetical protein